VPLHNRAVTGRSFLPTQSAQLREPSTEFLGDAAGTFVGRSE
jgi:hypothetical protein